MLFPSPSLSPRPVALPFLGALFILFLQFANVAFAQSADTKAPTVRIKSPHGLTIVPGGQKPIKVDIKGTASDDVKVTKVTVSTTDGLGNPVSVDATLTDATRGVEWTAPLAVVSGPNLVTVTAEDAAGNVSSVASAKFNVREVCDLTVLTGAGGKLKGKGGSMPVGRTLVFTGSPANDYLFQKAELQLAGAVSPALLSKTSTFILTVPNSPSATLSVAFATNPYSGLASTYNDLVKTPGGKLGYYTLTLARNGSVTLALHGFGARAAFKGSISFDGSLTFTSPASSTDPVTVNVQFDLALFALGLGGVKVEVIDGADTYLSQTRPFPLSTLPSYATIALRPGSGAPSSLKGSGYLYGVLGKQSPRATQNPAYRFAGRLADDTRVTFSVYPVATAGGTATLPILLDLFDSRKIAVGQVNGNLDWDAGLDQITGSLHWVRDTVVKANPPDAIACDLTLRGKRFTPPPSGTRLIPLNPTPFDTEAQITVAGRTASFKLPTLAAVFTLADAQVFKLRLFSSGALFFGTYVEPSGLRRNLAGVIIQDVLTGIVDSRTRTYAQAEGYAPAPGVSDYIDLKLFPNP